MLWCRRPACHGSQDGCTTIRAAETAAPQIKPQQLCPTGAHPTRPCLFAGRGFRSYGDSSMKSNIQSPFAANNACAVSARRNADKETRRKGDKERRHSGFAAILSPCL